MGLALLLGALLAPAQGETQLELIDGRVLSGIDVERDGDVYLLRTAEGDTIALPVELVATVRFHVKAEPEPEPELPTGLTYSEPQQLAGNPVQPRSAAEQNEVLGKPSTFQQGIFDSTWVPETDWNMDPVEQNNFAPSTWIEAPIDPTWTPKSAFDENVDVLAGSRSTFRKSIIDNEWKPTDGFAR